MLLKVIPESFEACPPGFSFCADGGGNFLRCSISGDALLDLAGHHGWRGSEEALCGSEEALFRALLPTIERLIGAKYRACRIEENGEVSISSADLLIYGFEAPPPATQPAVARGR
jgi:hypothetical protein